MTAAAALLEWVTAKTDELGRPERMAALIEPPGAQRCRACTRWTTAPICPRCTTTTQRTPRNGD